MDIREEVFYAMAKADCPIYEMQVKRVSLEDVFLELTGGEKEIFNEQEEISMEADRRPNIKTKKQNLRKRREASDEKEGGSVLTAIFKRELKKLS